MLSIFDLFKIGIGPSSSHTVGPMWAANRYLLELDFHGLIGRVAQVQAPLSGSLALTGKGHATDKALILGLSGEVPDKIDPDQVDEIVGRVKETRALPLFGRQTIAFDLSKDVVFHIGEWMEKHANGLRFEAFDAAGKPLREES